MRQIVNGVLRPGAFVRTDEAHTTTGDFRKWDVRSHFRKTAKGQLR